MPRGRPPGKTMPWRLNKPQRVTYWRVKDTLTDIYVREFAHNYGRKCTRVARFETEELAKARAEELNAQHGAGQYVACLPPGGGHGAGE